MKKRFAFIILGCLVLALLAGISGCAGTTPATTTAPTTSPSPSVSASLTPSSTIIPSPSPSIQASQSPTQPAKIKLKAQDQYFIGPPFAHWAYSGPGFTHKFWAKFVNDISDGQVEIEVLDPGTIVPATEQLSAVSKGILDAGFINYPGFYTSKYPECNVEIGLPFAWTRVEEHYDAIWYWGLYKEFQEFYEKELNVHMLPAVMNDIYHFGTTFPVDTPDAVKGKKIRALGIYGDYVKALGGVPTVLPAAELYQGLKLGTIDGTIYGISALSDLKLKEVWKYYVVEPNLNVIGGNAIINLDKWKQLPERVRILYDTWGYHIIYSAVSEYQQFEAYLVKDAEATGNFKTVKWSAEDTAKVYKIAIDLWDSVAAQNARAARWVGIVKDQARALGKIK